MNAALLDRARSVLVVVDVQERFMPAMHEAGRLLRRVELLAAAAKTLGVPVVVTEQYPRGLGPTVASLRAALPAGVEPVAKLEFSCAAVPAVAARLAALGRDQIVLAGVETHVCILQSALDLAAAGRAVHVAADATGARRPEDARAALERMARGDVTVTTAETAVFEWLRRAGTEEFRALKDLLKPL